MKTLPRVEIFTDGACRGNPGPGGWGVFLRHGQNEKKMYGAESHTTNNRMELQAAIAGLLALKYPCRVDLTTDSNYLRLGITQWLSTWKKKGWRGSSKQAVKNVDLWQQLEQAAQPHEIHWHWVKGHSNHRENDIADELANLAIDELLLKTKKHSA